MILWTIQPIEVYELIQSTGVYHCDYEKSNMEYWQEQYNWLVQEMKERVGEPPKGVSYPVWAWYMWEGARKIILLNGLLADTEEEDKSLERECEAMSPDAQKEYKYRNWKNVFDLTYVDNNWMHKGDSIQATFWELRKEDIKRVRFFTAASPKPKYLEVEE